MTKSNGKQPDEPIVRVETDSRGVMTMTLNRPDKLNAIVYPMIDIMLDALESAESDPNVRALVLIGTGRAFCAGDDLTGMGELTRPVPAGENPVKHMQQLLMRRWFWMPKPTIAAVRRNAHGIGHDLMLAADFRVIADDAKIGDIRARRAVAVGSGGTFLLPMMVGLPTASRIMLSGATIDADEADRLGLATRRCGTEELESATEEFAGEVAQWPTKNVGIMKTELRRNMRASIEDALDFELSQLDVPVEDREEGVRSFVEGRAPSYTGK
jgi:2-(1,2-epoxy-1,2-dihydrophenyl)acetyl-CoA isomerase